MPKLVMWAVAAVIVVLGPMAGMAARKILKRRCAEVPPESRSPKSIALRLGKDLAMPVASLGGLMLALALPTDLPIATTVARNTLMAALMVAVSYAVARLSADIVTSMVKAVSGIAGSVSLFATITRTIVFGIGILISLGSLGVQIAPLLGALGIGGLAVALALQGSLANLFAGLQILASGTVQIGDFVKMDSTGEAGWVNDINWRTTTIRDTGGNDVIVPNAKLADSILTNFRKPTPDISVPVEVGVAYDSDLDQVERVSIEVGREVMSDLAAGITEYDPVVRFHTFSESSIDFRVLLRSQEYVDQYALTSEFIKRLHKRYQLEGIEIPAPIRELRVSDTLSVANLISSGSLPEPKVST